MRYFLSTVSISPMPRALPGTSPMGMAMAELSPGLPVQALSLSTFHTSSTHSLSPVLFHPINPLHWWSPPYSPSLNCALIYPLSKVTFIRSHYMSVPSQCALLHPFNHSAVQSLIPNLPYMSSLLSLSHLDTLQAPCM